MRDVVVRWNNKFPLDNWYRKKYNIAFNSPQHRETSQIDVFFEWEENKMYEQIKANVLNPVEEIVEGKYLKPKVTTEQQIEKELELFDKLDIGEIKI